AEAGGYPDEEGAHRGHERGESGGRAEEYRLGHPGDPDADGGEGALSESGQHRPEEGHASHPLELLEEEAGVLVTQRGDGHESGDHARPVPEHRVHGEEGAEEAEKRDEGAGGERARHARRDAISPAPSRRRSVMLSGET